MKSSDELSIGELASRFGLATHVLRHWESIGLITPPRHGNGRRFYGAEHVARVAMIMRGKQAGLPLEVLGRMLDTATLDDRRSILAMQRAELEQKIAGLRASLELIDHALRCDEERYTQCGVFQDLVQVQLDGDTLVLHSR